MAAGVGEGSERSLPRAPSPSWPWAARGLELCTPKGPGEPPPRPGSLLSLWLSTSITFCVWSFFFSLLEFSTSDIKHPHENISLYCFEH